MSGCRGSGRASRLEVSLSICARSRPRRYFAPMDPARRPFVNCSACGSLLASRVVEVEGRDLVDIPAEDLREMCLFCGISRQYTIDDYYFPLQRA
jgi:hypothetical protein